MESVMERVRVFENYLDYAKKIKELLEKRLSSFELFVFGSVVRGNFSVGLSDIDIAILLNFICLPRSNGIFIKDL